MKIVLFVGNLNLWGHKHLALGLQNSYELLVVVEKMDTKTILFLELNGIDYVGYKERNIVIRLELFLRLFLRPLNTNNYKFGMLRNYLMQKKTNKTCFWKFLRIITPKIFSSNFIAYILMHIKGEFEKTIIDYSPDLVINIEVFVPIQHPILRLKKLHFKIYDLIYSWDNPFKFHFIPGLYDKYLVWNKFMGEDLNTLHKIANRKIVSIGGIQFDYLLGSVKKKEDKEYYYFAFSCGYKAAKQEIEFFKKIANRLYQINSERKIVARPYPNVIEPLVYDELMDCKNVIIEKVDNGLLQDDQSLSKKIRSFDKMITFINIGTTMALEAAYFDIPIIQINFLPKDLVYSQDKKHRPLDIDYIMKNDHLDKYLNIQKFENVVNSFDELARIFQRIEEGDTKGLLEYSKYLRDFWYRGECSSLNTLNDFIVTEYEKNT